VVRIEMTNVPARFPWLLLAVPVFIFATIAVEAIYRKRVWTSQQKK